MKLDALIDWYSTMTPETVSDIRGIYHERAHFRDPFNDVRGHQAIAAIFEHMFDTTEDPVFHITSKQRDGATAWVSWTFDFRLRGKALSIEGVTRLDFGEDGRVIDHRDHWDATDLLVQLPLLGSVLRYLKGRLSAPKPDALEREAIT
jgi:hypothetical protein